MSLISGESVQLYLIDEAGLLQSVGGLFSHRLSIQGTSVDISHAQSGSWRTMRDGGGLRQLTLSGEGWFSTNAIADTVRALSLGGLIKSWELHFDDALRVMADFQITALSYSANVEEEARFRVDLISSGEVSVVSQ